MTRDKRQQIVERLRMIEERLANGEKYLAKGVNVEGTSFLHFGDWRGKSGHPLWMKNHMIPFSLKQRANTEKMLDAIDSKAKDKEIAKRKRRDT